MSHVDLIVTAEKQDVQIEVKEKPNVTLEVPHIPGAHVIVAGNVGPPGPAGKWEALTQSEYDLLNPPDPDTLYVIIQ